MLDLDLSEDQEMLRGLVRDLCSDLAPLDTVRALEDDPVGIAVELWSKLGELGLCGLMIPTDHGGSAMSLLEGVVLYSELGRALAPVPHFVSCVLSAGALLKGAVAGPDNPGPDSQQSTANGPDSSSGERLGLLRSIASGDTIVVPAWTEPGGGHSPRGIQTIATADGDHVVLSGSKMHVYFAAAADHLLVAARSGAADTDIDLFLVPSNSAGVSLEQRMSISSDTQYRVDLDNVVISSANRVGTAGSGWEIWDSVMNEAAILSAALAVGGAERALEMAAEYATNRRQFDKSLAEFQSISHYLADARTELDGARLLTYEAAWAHSRDLDIARLAPMSKLFACRVYRDITAMAQQVFGGIGFTLDYDIQLYFRRAKQLQIMWWDTAECEDRVAAAVLD